MHYICPYEFLELSIGDPDELRNEELLGLHYWLEDEFRKSRAIRYKGRKIGRKAALKMVEVLRDPVMKEFCWRLYRRPCLKNFLETGEVRWFARIEKEAEREDHQFVNFVSEFYAPRYNEYLAGLVQSGEYDKAVKVIRNREWLNPNDYYDAYQDTRVLFWWRGKELEQKTHGFGITPEEKDRYFAPGMLRCLSALSDIYPQLADFYAASIGEAMVPTVNRRRDFALASEMLMAARTIPVNADLEKALNTVKSQLMDVIARRNPYTYMFIDLLPLKSVRKGKWMLWAEDMVVTAWDWVARIAVVVGVAVLLGLSWYSARNSEMKRDFLQEIRNDFKANSSADLPLFMELFTALSWDSRSPDAEKLPVSVPAKGAPVYQNWLGDPPGEIIGKKAIFHNETNRDAVVFLISGPPVSFHAPRHFYLPAGMSDTISVNHKKAEEVHVYLGINWTDALTYINGVPVGGFQDSVIVPKPLMRAELEKFQLPPPDAAEEEYPLDIRIKP